MAKKTVSVMDFKIQSVEIPIIGISPLIVHKFSEKAKKQIEDKQQGKAQNSKRERRNPQEDYEGAKHISSDGWEGFPAAGFKAAIIRAAKVTGMVMKDTQTALFVEADCPYTQLVKIEGECRLREDMVRIGMGSADVRYRPEYPEWKAVLRITYNEGILSLDQVFQLVKTAGFFCGIGEMRPEKTKFNFGRWDLAV
jgi:hypothetical protein